MKYKLFTSLIIASVLTTYSYATTNCIRNMDRLVNDDELNLSYCLIKSKDMPSIMAYLAQHPNIKSLNLEMNRIGSSGVAALAKYSGLTTLNVEDNGLNAADAAVLSASNSIETLNISDNKIGDEGVIALANNTHLKSIYVRNTGCGNTAAIALANSNTLKILDISLDNNFEDTGVI